MIRDGASCSGCGLPNYEGLCPVCRGDYPSYVEELQPFFGPWSPKHDEDDAVPPVGSEAEPREPSERSFSGGGAK